MLPSAACVDSALILYYSLCPHLTFAVDGILSCTIICEKCVKNVTMLRFHSFFTH